VINYSVQHRYCHFYHVQACYARRKRYCFSNSVRLSHCGIVSEQMHITSKSFHHLLGAWPYFCRATTVTKFQEECLSGVMDGAAGTLGTAVAVPLLREVRQNKILLYHIIVKKSQTYRWFSLLNLTKFGPRVGFGVVRIDPLRFLAGCRTRRLNQV